MIFCPNSAKENIMKKLTIKETIMEIIEKK